jgi:hypothetical protein
MQGVKCVCYIQYLCVCCKAIDDIEKEFLTSRQWGSIFTDDHVVANHVVDGKHYMNTLWGYVIRKYADIAIPQLEHVAGMSIVCFCSLWRTGLIYNIIFNFFFMFSINSAGSPR